MPMNTRKPKPALLVPLMALLLLLQGIAIALHSLLQLLGFEQPSPEPADREL